MKIKDIICYFLPSRIKARNLAEQEKRRVIVSDLEKATEEDNRLMESRGCAIMGEQHGVMRNCTRACIHFQKSYVRVWDSETLGWNAWNTGARCRLWGM